MSPSPNTNGNKDSALTAQKGINQVFQGQERCCKRHYSVLYGWVTFHRVCVCVPYIVFIRQGMCVCFHVLAVVENAAMIMDVRVSNSFSSFPDICWEAWLSGHLTTLSLGFEGTFVLLSLVAAPAHIPNNGGGSFLSTPSPARIICRLFDGRSDWCQGIRHYSSDLLFSSI